MPDKLPQLLFDLAAAGPGFLVAAVFGVLFWVERRRSEKLAERVISLAQESIRSDTEHTKAICALEKTLDSVERRIR